MAEGGYTPEGQTYAERFQKGFLGKAHGGMIMNDPHKLAAEIMAHHKRKMLAQGGMVKEDIDQVVPNSVGAEDFLSSENDDSHMLHNNEEFLSNESHEGNEKKRPNIPDTDPKPLVETILDRMRLKKMRQLR